MKQYNDPTFLREQYVDMRMTSPEIAAGIGCSDVTVRLKLHEFGIPIRDKHHRLRGNDLIVNDVLLEYLDGSLLGDGCLAAKTPVSARYQIGQKHLSYLLWVSRCLSEKGVQQAGKIRRYTSSWGSWYAYASKAYRGLRVEYDRWYPGGIKHVPSDVRLTPLSARTWFLEDGNLSPDKRRDNANTVTLCTECFTDAGIQVLLLGLQKRLETERVYVNGRRRIAFSSAQAIKAFFNYILPVPDKLSAEYGYKYI